MKPILFNTSMVRAILEGRKNVTRRVVNVAQEYINCDCDAPFLRDSENGLFYCKKCGSPLMACGPVFLKSPYQPGDILYVRETWRVLKAHRYDADAYIEFKAGGNGTVLRFPHGCTDSINRDNYDHFIEKWGVGGKWRPSIQMPREAARIFLRVKEVRAERLKDITDAGIRKEGLGRSDVIYYLGALRCDFAELWDRTVKPSDIALYGWDANPWVFVIEFERISKEECHESP